TDASTTPMQGIHQSARNAALVGFGTGGMMIVGAFILAVVQALTEHISLGAALPLFMIEALALSIAATVFIGMLFGGINLLKHFIMRVMLAQRDYLPIQILPFLTHADAL